ncbi:TetR/AcrR family transcriptional regulator [Actibacterium mucosum]|nr:TetR/AcrR family transcriptional regulator [Actibacterium mucosum]
MLDPKQAIFPRKQPRQGRSAATYEAILEAAARILEREGPEGLTTNLAAELAGVSVGSLYQYFPSKEAIIAELIRAMRDQMLADLTDAAASLQDAPINVAVERLVAASIRHHADRPALARVLEAAQPMLPLHAETAAREAEIQALIMRTLKGYGVADPDQVAFDLIALTKGMVDAAAQAGAQDFAAVQARVVRAARGYLG